MTININELKEGRYTYQMPEWKEPLEVILESDPTHKLVMRFQKVFQPVPLQDIPVNAIMKRLD